MNLIEHSYMTERNLKAYDGTPIVIVKKNEVKSIFSDFVIGKYGFDTESDYKTGDLKILQIYNQETVYIIDVNFISIEHTCPISKFFSSKNRIKIGVDIEGDQRKLVIFYSKLKREYSSRTQRRSSFTLNMNGFLDLQSIARFNGEASLSLNALSDKYVEDFIGNPSKLGSYNNPSDEEYIYAANDAVLSYKICEGLMSKTYCNRYLSNNKEQVFNYELEKSLMTFHLIQSLKEFGGIRKIINVANNIATTYKRWKSMAESFKYNKALEIIRDLAEDGIFTYYDPVSTRIGMIASEESSDDPQSSNIISPSNQKGLYNMVLSSVHKTERRKFILNPNLINYTLNITNKIAN